mmetsp:Transcript_81463/g.213871  ORF Transcript_81463/g.213871 Transcript_81463/m.213871 type:complete len:431 (-) Transcript_81463:145-1437(-)
MALGLQGEAPDPRRSPLEIHRHLLQAFLKALGEVVVVDQEVDGLAAPPDLAGVQEGRAEPLLQHAEAEVRAGVVQELEQGALVASLERLEDLERAERRGVEHHAAAHGAGARGGALGGTSQLREDVPSGEGEHPTAQHHGVEVVDGAGGGDDGALVGLQRLLHGGRELPRVLRAVLVQPVPGGHQAGRGADGRQLRPAGQPPDHHEDLGGQVLQGVRDLARLHLRHERAQRVAIDPVPAPAHLDLGGRAVNQAGREVCAPPAPTGGNARLPMPLVEVKVHHESGAGASQQLGVHQGALRVHLASVALDALRAIGALVLALLLLGEALHLLHDDHLVARVHQLLRVGVLRHLREADVRLRNAHPLQAALALRDEGVVVEQLVELAHLEQRDLVEVERLQLPVLLKHGGTVTLVLLLLLAWHPEGALVEHRV